jgi:hypothetical protein
MTTNRPCFVLPLLGLIPKTQNPTSHSEKLGLGVRVMLFPQKDDKLKLRIT